MHPGVALTDRGAVRQVLLNGAGGFARSGKTWRPHPQCFGSILPLCCATKWFHKLSFKIEPLLAKLHAELARSSLLGTTQSCACDHFPNPNGNFGPAFGERYVQSSWSVTKLKNWARVLRDVRRLFVVNTLWTLRKDGTNRSDLEWLSK